MVPERLSSHTSACIQLYQNHGIDCSPYYLMYGKKPKLPIDIKFGLVSPQAEEYSHNKFLAKLSAQLRGCYELTDLHQCKECTCHRYQYDCKMRASELVRQKVCRGKHKIGDCWENTKYVVVEWQPNLPVYTIKPWQGEGQTQVVHRTYLCI